MTWADAKARIAVDLAAVSITSPVAQTIKHVYVDPPGSIQDLPCFIIYPPACKLERANSIRYKHYAVRLRLLLSDEKLDRASALVDAYREALLDALDAEVTLEGTATLIEGPDIEEAADFEIPQGSGKHYTGFDALLTVHIREAKTFSG
jgi:hypothetical protein